MLSADPSASVQGDSSRKPGKYGTACVGCRKRKQRCDAKMPICSRCEKMHEDCVYESSVRSQLSSSQIIPTLKSTFRFIHHLTTLDARDPSVDIPRLAKSFLEQTTFPIFATADSTGAPHESGRTESRTDELGKAEFEAGTVSPDVDRLEDTGEAEIDELLMHMSLGNDGQNAHFGVTSFMWQTPSPSVVQTLQRKTAENSREDRKNSFTEISSDLSARLSTRNTTDGPWATEDGAVSTDEDVGVLKANSEMLQGWTALAHHKLELDHGKDVAMVMMHLLQTYWCWVNPQHCILYSPIFYRDMALGGEYFNTFLLNAICATAARYSDLYSQPDNAAGSVDGTRTPAGVNNGSEYLARAKLLLAVEMDKPSTIPTIQGLMLLGIGECAKGNLSQGWQYTGMSFRAIRDLGIHLDCSRLPIFGFGTLAAEDRELRRRLFWSAFSWDKIISLALGRTPTFNAWQNVSPGMIADNTEDDINWVPVFWQNNRPLDMLLYPPHKSYTTTNHRHFTKLCEIAQKIIMRLYDGRPRRLRNLAFVAAMKERLAEWFLQLPSFLKMDTASLPDNCPPPHIFSTNALYRATYILLYRTFLPQAWPVRLSAPPEIASEASSMCTKMAEEIHALFTLYHKSFHLRNMTYTTLWSMYSAATINTVDFRSDDPEISAAASSRLVFSIHVLEGGSVQSPGILRSVQAIKSQLRQPAPPRGKRRREEERPPSTESAPLATIIETPAAGADTTTEWDQFFQSLQMPHEVVDLNIIDNSYSLQSGTNSGVDLLQSMLAMPSSQNAMTLDGQTWSEWPAAEWFQPFE